MSEKYDSEEYESRENKKYLQVTKISLLRSRIKENKENLERLEAERDEIQEKHKAIERQIKKNEDKYESNLKSIEQEYQKDLRAAKEKMERKKKEAKENKRKGAELTESSTIRVVFQESGNEDRISSTQKEVQKLERELNAEQKVLIRMSEQSKAIINAVNDVVVNVTAKAEKEADQEEEKEKINKGCSHQIQSHSHGRPGFAKTIDDPSKQILHQTMFKSAALPSDADAIMYAGRKNNFDIGKIDPIHMEKEEMKKASTVEEQVQVARREEEEARDQEAKAVELRKDLECEKRNFNGAADAVEANRRIVLSFERTEDFASKRRNEVALSPTPRRYKLRSDHKNGEPIVMGKQSIVAKERKPKLSPKSNRTAAKEGVKAAMKCPWCDVDLGKIGKTARCRHKEQNHPHEYAAAKRETEKKRMSGPIPCSVEGCQRRFHKIKDKKMHEMRKHGIINCNK